MAKARLHPVRLLVILQRQRIRRLCGCPEGTHQPRLLAHLQTDSGLPCAQIRAGTRLIGRALLQVEHIHQQGDGVPLTRENAVQAFLAALLGDLRHRVAD